MSTLFLPTEREPPADAEALSHKLMVRAGLIRQVGSGLWSWMPAGWRVHRKAEQIVREEIDAIGGQEMLMPVLLPADYWKRSGRYESVGAELFRLQRPARRRDGPGDDRTRRSSRSHVASAVRSYRDLPLILYHFQTKERDEPRPRAGVLRTREFIMKDSYTFDRDAEGLDVGYDKHIEAYDRIFDRAGPGVVPGRVRRRDDGRQRRPRVHGAVRGGGERGRARARLRRQRRGRRAPSPSRWSCPRRSTRPSEVTRRA